MGNLFSRKRLHWVPQNRKLIAKVNNLSNWNEKEDWTAFQIQNDPIGTELFMRLHIAENLVELNLGFNGIGDQACRKIASSIRLSKTMKRLILENNSIHSEGAGYLAEALIPSSGLAEPCLEDLNLRNNTIGAQGAVYFAPVLSSNRTLRRLVLYWNNLRNSGLRAICMNLPSPPLPHDYLLVIYKLKKMIIFYLLWNVFFQDVRYNGFEPTAVDIDWEEMLTKLRASKLVYSEQVSESDRQFLGWPFKN